MFRLFTGFTISDTHGRRAERKANRCGADRWLCLTPTLQLTFALFKKFCTIVFWRYNRMTYETQEEVESALERLGFPEPQERSFFMFEYGNRKNPTAIPVTIPTIAVYFVDLPDAVDGNNRIIYKNTRLRLISYNTPVDSKTSTENREIILETARKEAISELANEFYVRRNEDHKPVFIIDIEPEKKAALVFDYTGENHEERQT
ncbi:MAG: hypothetical protein NT120_02725 [Candidatus Aenigmarchaeota archaeon]|nr:hypothetical protein [Candidatus Aenigmarchaeota archaeon]